MDIVTVVVAIIFGYLGTVIFGNLLNLPDAGAIIAIAFVGGRIVHAIHQEQDPNDKNQNGEE